MYCRKRTGEPHRHDLPGSKRNYIKRRRIRAELFYARTGAPMASKIDGPCVLWTSWQPSPTLLDVSETLHVLSGYRSPQTNAMLALPDRECGPKTPCTCGVQAADLRLASRSVNQMARAAIACNGRRLSVRYFSGLELRPQWIAAQVRNWGG